MAGAIVALGAGAFADRAAATWGSARIVDHYISAAAGNARGEQAFTWTSRSPFGNVMLGSSPYTGSFPMAQLRLAGGAVTRPQALTSRHGIVGDAGAIGLDGRGAATALWTRTRAHAIGLFASVRSPGGHFGRGSQLGQVASSSDYDHVLRVAPDGGAVVVWNGGERIYAALRSPGRCPRGAPRACFGRPRSFARCPSGVDDCLEYPNLDVDIATGGRVFLTWSQVARAYFGYRTLIRLAVARPGRGFGHSIAISSDPDVALNARVAHVRDGGAVVTWTRGSTLGRNRVVAVGVEPDGERRSAATVLSDPTCIAGPIRVNPRDEVTIAWICQHEGGLDHISIAASVSSAAGPLAQGTDLGRRDYASRDALGLDGAGNAVLVYSPDGQTVVARVRPPGGAFGEPLPVPTLTGSRAPVERGGRLIEAGPRLTLLQIGDHVTSQLRDWTP